jgi:hypothetical protein
MIRKKSAATSIAIPSLQDLLEGTPPPDSKLLDGTPWDRKDYDQQETKRIRYRSWILFQSLGIEECVFDTALSMQQRPDLYNKAWALLNDPRFDRLIRKLGQIREEETAVSQAWLEKRAACVLCGGPGGFYRLDGLCDDCHHSKPSTPPVNGIRSALARARQARIPATLTEEEWQRTIEHFGDRCAYCKGPWCLVEHATPIPRGGTTADNCLPACTSCNIQKGNATIEELEPTEHVHVALAWLHNCGRSKESP